MTTRNTAPFYRKPFEEALIMRQRFWRWFPSTWAGRIYATVHAYLSKADFMARTYHFKKGQSPESRPLGLNVVGYYSAISGVGEAVRLITQSCERADVPFSIYNLEAHAACNAEIRHAHLFQRDNPHAVNLIHVNADSVFHLFKHLDIQWLLKRFNIGYWVWELEKFPRKWRAAERCFNEIWTASEFCRRSISRTVSIPVVRIPHAVEIKLESSYSKKDFGIDDTQFAFLFIFDFLSVYRRKNPLAIVEAFQRAFGEQKDVLVVFKFTNAQAAPSAHRELMQACQGLRLPFKFIDTFLSRDELNGLISVCDCYISLHRSEGFGLTLAEAMYLEKPVIATAYSGNMDFMTKDNSFPVKYRMAKIGKGAEPYSDGYWAEPDVNHAAELMRSIYEERTEAALRARRAALDIRRDYSHEAIGRLIKERLDEIVKIHSHDLATHFHNPCYFILI
jgi:glycosyltransferase involved in cell wall biosynthesis